MRQVVLDTETTGLAPSEGHRIIEIGCTEIVDRNITGKEFHTYLNPERAIDPGAQAVHGISLDFLQDKPLFADIAKDFLAFIKGSELVIHNAVFDTGFINYELSQLADPMGTIERYCTVFDTLTLARAKHPGVENSLDALCRRYKVDASQRTKHGALLDTHLLAQVYLLMTQTPT